MGLSIHYSATLKAPSNLSELISEVTEISNALNWKCTIVATSELSGIVVSPPNCEPLSFCFAPDCDSCGIDMLNEDTHGDERNAVSHVKTAYAGPEIHKALVDVLAYISGKYFRQINVYDEGEYWETRDYEILLSHFGSARDPDPPLN